MAISWNHTEISEKLDDEVVGDFGVLGTVEVSFVTG